MHIQWFPRDPPRITTRLDRSLDRHIRQFQKEHHRRPRCGICHLSDDLREVTHIEFEPAEQDKAVAT